MKEFCKKLSHVLNIIFGYGIMITLFVGGLTFFGYVAGLVIGGDTAAAICKFIYKGLYPWLIRASTVLVLLGLVGMYLGGEKALTSEKSGDKKK